MQNKHSTKWHDGTEPFYKSFIVLKINSLKHESVLHNT